MHSVSAHFNDVSHFFRIIETDIKNCNNMEILFFFTCIVFAFQMIVMILMICYEHIYLIVIRPIKILDHYLKNKQFYEKKITNFLCEEGILLKNVTLYSKNTS